MAARCVPFGFSPQLNFMGSGHQLNFHSYFSNSTPSHGWDSRGQVMFLNEPLDVLVESGAKLMFNRAFYVSITKVYGLSIIPEWMGI